MAAYIRTFVTSLFILTLQSHGAVVIPGDSILPDTSTATMIRANTSAYTFDNHHGPDHGWIGFILGTSAHNDSSTIKYPLYYMNEHDSKVYPANPRQAVIDPSITTTAYVYRYPLENKHIQFVNAMEGENAGTSMTLRILMVTQEEPNNIYVSYVSDTQQTGPLNDAQETPHKSQAIVGLGASKDHVLAAIQPQNQPFGSIGSGIALSIFGKIDNYTAFKQFNAVDGKNVPRAYPFDTTSSFLKLNGENINAFGQHAAIHWDPFLERFFVGVDLQTQHGGGRSIVVGRLTEKNTLEFYPIAPVEAFSNQDTIIGSTQDHVQINVHHLRTMRTSTNLNYLIVHGGIGEEKETQQTVFALPLISYSGQENTIGTLANKHNVHKTTYALTVPAIAPDHMAMSQDAAAVIGGGPVRKGSINSIIIAGDVVYALVDQSTPQNETHSVPPGAFYSQALFDASGMIKGWTSWKRAAGITQPVIGLAHNCQSGTISYLIGTEQDGGNIIKRTKWGTDNDEGLGQLNTQLSKLFVARGGVSHINDFPHHTPGLGNATMACVASDSAVALIQTGYSYDSIKLTPKKGSDFAQLPHYHEAKISIPITHAACTLSGGDLAKIGWITASTIATDTKNNAWFVVGGINGIAVLCDEKGGGWNPDQGPGDLFSNISAGMRFKIVDGPWKNVRKLIADGPLLYVLCDNNLWRINTQQNSLGSKKVSATSIATAQSHVYEAFFDLVVSGKLALLASNKGLKRTGNGADVSQAQSTSAMRWTSVNLPEGSDCIVQLQVTSATALETDLARGIGGQVYVLEANAGSHQSRLYRLSIAGLADNEPVSDTTVQLFPDMFVKEKPTYLLNFGQLVRHIATDGARYWCDLCTGNPMRSFIGILPNTPIASHQNRPVYPISICSGNSSMVRSLKIAPLEEQEITQIQTLSNITKNSALGSWWAGGNFGLWAHE